MKLSIWQQFSSNHSTYFIIIGRFANPKNAEQRAELLRDWMYRMLWGNDRKEVEEEIKATYGVDWYENGIDWNGLPTSINRVVQQVGVDVFMMCQDETWDSSEPFIDLMSKMGAEKIWSYQQGDFSIDARITAIAPSEQAAATFCNTLEALKVGAIAWEIKPIWLNPRSPIYLFMNTEAQHQERTVQINLEMLPPDGLVRFISYLNESGYSDIQYELDYRYVK